MIGLVMAVTVASAAALARWTGVAVLAAGVAFVLGWDIVSSAGARQWLARLRLSWERVRVVRAVALDESDMKRAEPLCSAFAIRYPYVLRVPFRLGDDSRVSVAPSAAEWVWNEQCRVIPGLYEDLQTLLQQKNLWFSHPLVPILQVNRAVRRHVRQALERDLLQGMEFYTERDWSRLWLRFFVWERQRQAGDGGPSLVYREELAATLASANQLPDRLSSGAAVARWMDGGIERAQTAALARKRALRLRARLEESMAGDASLRRETPDPVSDELAGSVEELAVLMAAEPLRVTQWLKTVFGGQTPGDGGEEALGRGTFIAHTGDQRVVFQVGDADELGAIRMEAIERAFTARVRESAQRAVILCLGEAPLEVCRAADELGVLILPAGALDRLLAYHVDRMGQAVDWSLRVSQKPMHDPPQILSDNGMDGLELGLST